MKRLWQQETAMNCRENYLLSLFGPSQINDLIVEKGQRSRLAVLAFSAGNLLDACSNGHALKRGQSGPTVNCSSCGSAKKPRSYNKNSLKAQNLLERFMPEPDSATN